MIRPSREPYRIVNEPRGPRSRDLLREGARVSDRFLSVDIPERFYREHDTSFGPAAKRLVEELAPHLISLTSDRSWPGTRLGEVHGVKSYARIYRYRLDAESLEMLERATDHLFSWQPPLPGLPRLRSIQRRQLKACLAWATRRFALPEPRWLDAVPD